MDYLKLQSIIAGTYRLRLKNDKFFVKRPSFEWQLDVEQFDNEFLDEQFLDSLRYNLFLENRNIWLPDDEKKVSSLSKDIEELKVRMFQCNFNSKELEASRRVLKLANNDLEKLLAKKHSYSFLSAEIHRQLNRMKALFAGSIYKPDGKPLFKSLRSWMCFPCSIFDHFIQQYREQQADELEIRFFARTEPWRSFWAGRKACAFVFGIPSIELNEQQKSLIGWSITFDVISEHPKCPPEEVLSDNDRLDGWLIIQKRERDKALGNIQADDFIKNEKIKNSGEIFIKVGSQSDLAKVDDLNTPDSQRLIKQRMSYLMKKGTVKESEMPDSKLKIEQMRTKSMAAKAGNNG